MNQLTMESFLSNEGLTPEVSTVLQNVFQSCDEDQDGFVTVSIFISFLKKKANGTEILNFLDDLTNFLDMEGNDPPIDWKTCEQGLHDWIRLVNQKSLAKTGNSPTSYLTKTSPLASMGNSSGRPPKKKSPTNIFLTKSISTTPNTPTSRFPSRYKVSPTQLKRLDASFNVSSSSTYSNDSIDCSDLSWDQSDVLVKVEELEITNKRLLEDNAKLKSHLHNTEDQNSVVLHENDQLKSQLVKCEKMLEDNKKVCKSYEELKLTVVEYQNIKNDLIDKTCQLEKENTSLQQALADYEVKISKLDTSLEVIKEEKCQLKQEITAQRNLLFQIEDLKTSKESVLEESSNKSDYMSSVIAELSLANEVLKAQKNTIEQELSELKQDMYRMSSLEGFNGVHSTPLLSSTARYEKPSLQQEIKDLNSSLDTYDANQSLRHYLDFSDVSDISPSASEKCSPKVQRYSHVAKECRQKFKEKKEMVFSKIEEIVNTTQHKPQDGTKTSLIVEELDRDLESFTEKIAEFAQGKMTAEKRALKLAAALKKLKEEKNGLEESRDKAVQMYGNLSITSQETQGRLETVTKELTVQTKTIDELRQQIAEKQKCQFPCIDFGVQCSFQNEMWLPQEKDRTTYENQIQDLKKLVENLESRNLDSARQIFDLEEELTAHKKKTESLENELSTFRSQFTLEMQDILRIIPNPNDSFSRQDNHPTNSIDVKNRLLEYINNSIHEQNKLLTRTFKKELGGIIKGVRESPDGGSHYIDSNVQTDEFSYIKPLSKSTRFPLQRSENKELVSSYSQTESPGEYIYAEEIENYQKSSTCENCRKVPKTSDNDVVLPTTCASDQRIVNTVLKKNEYTQTNIDMLTLNKMIENYDFFTNAQKDSENSRDSEENDDPYQETHGDLSPIEEAIVEVIENDFLQASNEENMLETHKDTKIDYTPTIELEASIPWTNSPSSNDGEKPLESVSSCDMLCDENNNHEKMNANKSSESHTFEIYVENEFEERKTETIESERILSSQFDKGIDLENTKQFSQDKSGKLENVHFDNLQVEEGPLLQNAGENQTVAKLIEYERSDISSDSENEGKEKNRRISLTRMKRNRARQKRSRSSLVANDNDTGSLTEEIDVKSEDSLSNRSVGSSNDKSSNASERRRRVGVSAEPVRVPWSNMRETFKQELQMNNIENESNEPTNEEEQMNGEVGDISEGQLNFAIPAIQVEGTDYDSDATTSTNPKNNETNLTSEQINKLREAFLPSTVTASSSTPSHSKSSSLQVPSLNESLNSLDLNPALVNTQPYIDDIELEKKFNNFVFAFKTDKYTLKKRIDNQERARDVSESSMDKEIAKLGASLKDIRKFEKGSSEYQDLFLNLQKQSDILRKAAMKISAQSEQHGCYQQEYRMSPNIQVVIEYADTLRFNMTKMKAELQEIRQQLEDYASLNQTKDLNGNETNSDESKYQTLSNDDQTFQSAEESNENISSSKKHSLSSISKSLIMARGMSKIRQRRMHADQLNETATFDDNEYGTGVKKNVSFGDISCIDDPVEDRKSQLPFPSPISWFQNLQIGNSKFKELLPKLFVFFVIFLALYAVIQTIFNSLEVDTIRLIDKLLSFVPHTIESAQKNTPEER